MAYYMAGDYYRGSGDPGIFGSIFGGIKGAVGGFLKGGPLGALGGAIQGARGQPAAPAYTQGPLRMIPATAPSGGGLFGRLRTAGQALVPGGVEPGTGCPAGYHADKATGTKCVKNRRMNPGNAKALRRSIRREAAFIGLAKRTLKGSGYTFKRTGVARKRKR